MSASQRNVLFLCTGNSARSVLGEAILDARGGARFRGHSAGSHPTGRVNPGALAALQRHGHDVSNLRSKSWDEFAGAGAPEMHWVFTVCDNAAGESCPIWIGSPRTVHWGLPDPAAVVGSDSEVAAAFETTYDALSRRIDEFLLWSAEVEDDEALYRRLTAYAS